MATTNFVAVLTIKSNFAGTVSNLLKSFPLFGVTLQSHPPL